MPTNPTTDERRARRRAHRQGLHLVKSRRRDPQAVDHGGYMLVDSATNGVVMGAVPYAYSASLPDVEVWLATSA